MTGLHKEVTRTAMVNVAGKIAKYAITMNLHGVRMRPVGVRDPDADVFVAWETVYLHGFQAQTIKPRTRRRVSRSLI